MNTGKIGFWSLAAAVALTVHLRAATVTATLDPQQIEVGESAQLTVSVSGSAEQPNVPNVDGLVIQAVSQGTQMSIVNGSITSSASVTYAITPQRAGAFTIPAIQAGGAKSQPVTLHVTQGGAAAAQSSGAPGAQMPTPSGQGPVVLPPTSPSTPGSEPVAPGKFGSIEITLPKKEFYEGELVPVDIKVFLTSNCQVSQLPTFSCDGVALDALSHTPAQDQEVVNGRAYSVLTWHSALTALKPGEFTVSMKMPVTVIVPPRMPSMDDDQSFDSFFRNAFASIGGTRKDVTITGSMEPVKVLALPQANRPAGFSGAVGQFEAEASATPTRVNAGDPITLKLQVTGRGNFDRVASEMLPADANWKTYTPKSHFEAAGGLSYQGQKTFEQPAIPNNGSITAVPSLDFSYFDPELRQYVTRTTAPIPITVAGAPAVPSLAAAPAANPSTGAAANPPAPASGPDLRMNRVESGAFVASLRPVYLNPLFLAGQALPLVALLGGLAFLRRREKISHPDRARSVAMQAAIRREVEAMDAAMRDHQAGEFFVHARNALQQRFGRQWNIRPEAITVADLDARLGAESANVRTIFEMADQASYSDLRLADSDLEQWRQIVLNELVEAKP